MNIKPILYKAIKGALVGAAGAFAASTQNGVPMDKAALIALGGAVLGGAAHAAINAIEQALGYQVVNMTAPAQPPS